MAFNVMVTFLLSGLWHGASWNFIIWGALNGLGVLPELLRTHQRHTPDETPVPRVNLKAILHLLATFAFICATWVFFRAATFDSALLIFRRLGSALAAPSSGLLKLSDVTEGGVWIAVALMLAAEWIQRRHWHPLVFPRWHVSFRWVSYSILLWAVLYMGTHSSSPFIYFQF
jgi:hypothetical protein